MSTTELDRNSTTLVGNEQLLEIAQSIWSSMLGLAASPDRSESLVRDPIGLMASVHIAGAWNGLVVFLPTATFARRAASLMLAMPPDSVSMAEIEDAVAELSNIIGGSVKALLPGPSSLSLPVVLHGSQYAVRMPRTRLAANLRFTCEGQPLEIRILEGYVATSR
jgi:chemotaxis protein CheX